MVTLMIGMQDSLFVLESSNKYKIHECLKGTDPQIIAFDPKNPSRSYCGTFGDGLIVFKIEEIPTIFTTGIHVDKLMKNKDIWKFSSRKLNLDSMNWHRTSS